MLRLISYLKPYWKAALLAPLLMLLEVVMDLMQPTLMATIIDKGVATHDTSLILRTGALMVGVALVGAIGGMGCTVFASIASTNFGTDLRRAVFEKVQCFSFANLDTFEPASLVTRLTNDVMQVQGLVMACLRILVRAPLLVIGGVVMAVSIDAKLSSIIILALPVLAIALYYIMSKGFPLFTEAQKRLDRVNAVMQENLTGVRVVKAFVRADFENKRFSNANDALITTSIKAGRLMGAQMPIMMLVMNISVICVLWFGGIRVNGGSMQVGQVIAFTNYMTQILFSLMMVAFFLMSVSRAKASGDRITQVLETSVDITDAPDASTTPVASGSIVFEDVTFSYPGAGGDPVLKGVSFLVNPGETVAILGSTGSGKSSLVNLIPRFYDVTSGRIIVDGRDVRKISIKTLRQSIGMVLQESILFSGTIAENLRWGNVNATDEEIQEAAKAAQAHDFISKFPKGYDTAVGQRGVNLSGGQKQRLSIARALLSKPTILILDDSTSAVDMGTEARLQAALREMAEKTTCLVIAQRISTVMDADRIVVLEDGQVAGMGTHEELLQTCPVYKDICRSQLGKEAV